MQTFGSSSPTADDGQCALAGIRTTLHEESPRAGADAHYADATMRAVRTGRTRPLVLFIEDNLTQLDLYVMVLEEHMDVITATRGEAGYELACTERPDMIVTASQRRKISSSRCET